MTFQIFVDLVPAFTLQRRNLAMLLWLEPIFAGCLALWFYAHPDFDCVWKRYPRFHDRAVCVG